MAGPGVAGHAPPAWRPCAPARPPRQRLGDGRPGSWRRPRSSAARSTSRPSGWPAADRRTRPCIEELVRRGIVRELMGGHDAAFDFAHARLREAAYEHTGLARRRLLHRRVADVLRADLPGRDDPGRLALIAGHEQAAGRDTVAAEAHREAGSRVAARVREPGGARAPPRRPSPWATRTSWAPGRDRWDPHGAGRLRGGDRFARGGRGGRGRGDPAGDRAAARAGPRPPRGMWPRPRAISTR